ncbi:hypothetical protein J2Y89_000389 [Curtobacterium herbarum]|uniref:hypothetical protein n=1 Tax=Curtobacterium TaxID=2034 RepID=UPI0020A0ADC9|nr:MULTISPECIES: hypothetical protein [Curtobacterium]MCP1501645.1 hypothetical protein [Curtobacterium herbarum]MDN3479986.1 hypothetical protein [Curtobacterium sp. APC 4022]
MSTNLALVDPVVAPSRAPRPDSVRPERQRPELVEVTPTKAQRRARPRVAYAIVAIAALGLLLLAQLGISMALSQGAYTLSSLKTEQTGLTRTQASLSEGLKVLESPQNLARNAQALGMIANSTPVYLDPKTGTVYGTPTPATPEEATGNTANQVPNSLLGDVPLAARPGDTATSKENSAAAPAAAAAAPAASPAAAAPAAAAPAAAADTEKAGASSASDQPSAKSSVESDANQLQAPTTR